MIELVLAKIVYERLQTDLWVIVNFRGKNLTALQSQLAITMTYVVASQHPSYLLFFPSHGRIKWCSAKLNPTQPVSKMVDAMECQPFFWYGEIVKCYFILFYSCRGETLFRTMVSWTDFKRTVTRIADEGWPEGRVRWKHKPISEKSHFSRRLLMGLNCVMIGC